MKIAEIREAFLNYFEEQNHQRVASSSLVPGNDPTLLFTNAGMVQFKDVFLGSDKRPFVRACSSQRCVRAGGKHNDLENVGYTARHHTFFEMLGNFSFGDYFKHDAIRFAWDFLTKVLQLPEDKLWVTVHVSDDEAQKIWFEEIGIDQSRFSRLDEDNFWQMGDTGPCGPCSEIFYDHGPDVEGGPPGSENDDGDRYVEIWNLVFMQYERSASGDLTPLPNPSIDTGAGLERVAAVMQGVKNNYDIDLFQGLIDAVVKITGAKDRGEKSLQVIADHIRSCSFLIVDGVIPGNEGRSYVLRRIIRRAIRHGNKLGKTDAFFHQLVPALVEQMGEAYPELVQQQERVQRILLSEEEQFAKTLDNGMAILDEALSSLDGQSTVISGDLVFKLYDTYGFPVDLTNDIARERGLTLDMAGYEAAMEAQKKRSQEAGSFSVDYSQSLKLEGSTDFRGYQQLNDKATVLHLIKDGEAVDSLEENQQGVVILDQTTFYAESGGQVGDQGALSGPQSRFDVSDTTKGDGHFLHHGNVVSGKLSVGDTMDTQVAAAMRRATGLNHSATHLLHAALRQVLGDHVAQKGSLVDSERLRFDFSHFEAVTNAQLRAIEDLVNDQILKNSDVETQVTDMESAKAKGAMALFGEKYGDEVRVLSMGEGFSVELCGGTHVSRTGDIGQLMITSESGIAAGVRRIEAITGSAALSAIHAMQNDLGKLAQLVKTNPDKLIGKIEQLISNNKKLEKDLEQLKGKLASSAGTDLAAKAQDIGGVKVLAEVLEGADRKALLSTSDQLKNKLGSAVLLLASVDGDNITLIAGVTKDLTKKMKAGDLMKAVAEQLGGKGGGRPDMAQGAGKDVAGLPAAMASVFDFVKAAVDA